jgi:aryl-phospho-beta-D-glucosidase BglC (GH1 family)
MRYCGFNMLYMFVFHEQPPGEVNERELDFIANQGFTFVRIPTDYRFWTKDFDYLHPDERVFEKIDGYFEACRKRGLHCSLNLHRAPGYCINRNDIEKHNLWKDEEAFEAFLFLWEGFAKRYKGISPDEMSFDLLNEPPSVRQYGFTRKRHAAIMRTVIKAIKDIDGARPVIIDGIGGGHEAMPELADAGAIHSGRGYQPFQVSHNGANWCRGMKWEKPVYPGITEGTHWDRDELKHFYAPWLAVEKKGVPIHIGEFGCYNKTPNDVALRWLSDLMSLYKELGWGYAMWNFKGPFGIVEHGRPGAKYTEMDGFQVDKELLNIMKINML